MIVFQQLILFGLTAFATLNSLLRVNFLIIDRVLCGLLFLRNGVL